ncbi:MAG: hypothetical protein ACLTFW_28115 [Klebsiella pneumoniae]
MAHYLKMISARISARDRRLLELELNTWVRSLVTEADPGDSCRPPSAARCQRGGGRYRGNPGFFRVKLYAVPLPGRGDGRQSVAG